MHGSILSLLILFATLVPCVAPAQAPAAIRDSLATRDSRLATVVYLVRHAEKLDDSRDPPLNDAGTARAGALAGLLRDAGITHVWTTNFLRTRHTALPLAERLGLEVRVYNPARLPEFAAELLRTPGRHLVVGHSNTTGETVGALGGSPGDAIQDDEYDRLYVVAITGDGAVTSLLRFGAGRP